MGPDPLSSSLQRNGTLRLPQALLSLLKSYLAGTGGQSLTDLTILTTIKTYFNCLGALLNPLDYSVSPNHPIVVGMVKSTILCGLGYALYNLRIRKADIATDKDGFRYAADAIGHAAAATDPGLLRKYSTMRKYTVPATGFTYTGIRTYFQRHTHEQQLPQEPKPVPLLVFIHGLGGSTAQFHPLLSSLSNIATCLAIDLPGCGVSVFDPEDWEAYTTGSLVHLLATVINAHRDVERGQDVVLVGHSLGCSLAVMLASPTSPYAHLLSQNVAGLIAFCPNAEPPSLEKQRALRSLTYMPTFLFDLMRKFDRRGGVYSGSVTRMAGTDVDLETKKLQLRFNKLVRSDAWKRIALGVLTTLPEDNVLPTSAGCPGKTIWAGLRIPLLLAAGASDTLTKPENVDKIAEFLEDGAKDVASLDSSSDTELEKRQEIMHNDGTRGQAGQAQSSPKPIPSSPSEKQAVVKKIIMPHPAAHSFIFTPGPTLHTLLGHINTFLANNVDARLASSWQMQYFTTEGKWEVKNIEKWRAVPPVSAPIAKTFRALKTLRGVDATHCPRNFVKEWAGKLIAVVDISHDTPVYDPKELIDGGIAYRKFPTVSKLPPVQEEVAEFCDMIDEIRGGVGEKGEGIVGVHCHYGFNRTGFFLVSYMVERLGYKVEDAIAEFGAAREPGIRHQYFIQELYVRYG
ncbi:hypothetical protein CC80DRAFT_478743 [Byssothecium circinans]|uniref:Tyrosine specific protein phosphatases domain-containing protein n=1 Tax=Byssothecium circinans TaxID=147558 RepID=A0A6A5TJY3_9PLEO|nr:hypothetical protein CC80DRAFT_478743 [Byssothecium circinans]